MSFLNNKIEIIKYHSLIQLPVAVSAHVKVIKLKYYYCSIIIFLLKFVNCFSQWQSYPITYSNLFLTSFLNKKVCKITGFNQLT